jgi:hypothetical protein
MVPLALQLPGSGDLKSGAVLTTRSGRVCLAPLEYWRNERLVRDPRNEQPLGISRGFPAGRTSFAKPTAHHQTQLSPALQPKKAIRAPKVKFTREIPIVMQTAEQATDEIPKPVQAHSRTLGKKEVKAPKPGGKRHIRTAFVKTTMKGNATLRQSTTKKGTVSTDEPRRQVQSDAAANDDAAQEDYRQSVIQRLKGAKGKKSSAKVAPTPAPAEADGNVIFGKRPPRAAATAAASSIKVGRVHLHWPLSYPKSALLSPVASSGVCPGAVWFSVLNGWGAQLFLVAVNRK